MRSQLNYSSYPKILPIIIQYNQAILMHGGIYRCTGIYFFKSAKISVRLQASGLTFALFA